MNDDNNIEKGIISSEQPQIFNTTFEEDLRKAENSSIISLVISGIRIIISITACSTLLFHLGYRDGYGVIYGMGLLNCFWMAEILGLNIKASVKNHKARDKRVGRLIIWAWSALAVVLIFTFLIFLLLSFEG